MTVRGGGLQRIPGGILQTSRATCPTEGCTRTVVWVRTPMTPWTSPPPCRVCQAEQELREAPVGDDQDALFAALKLAGVSPWEHGDATFAAFDASESGPGPVAAAQAFLDDVLSAGKWGRCRWLYLAGNTGTGKSMLAAATVRHAIEGGMKPEDVLFESSANLISAVQDTYNSDLSTRQVRERRTRARLYVLDDIGAEKPSPDASRILGEILAERCLRPTMLTSNRTPPELEQHFPEFERITSRLGPRYCRTVAVKGRDRRFDPPTPS